MNDKKLYLIPFISLTVLLIISYVLTLIFPCVGISVAKFLLSPILNLGSDAGTTTIVIIIFLLILSGVSKVLEKCNFLEYMLTKIAGKYGKRRYGLITSLTFFFMALGSLAGSFEEIIPLVPIATKLAIDIGFDAYTGIAMSLLAAGCGFATGIANPFSIGIAQELAGLAMFSEPLIRIISFVLIYCLLIVFILINAKRVAKPIDENNLRKHEVKPEFEIALKLFLYIMGTCILLTLSSSVLSFLRDYTLIIMALGFVLSAISAAICLKLSIKKFFDDFVVGFKEMIPSIILILMASGIRYIMDESGCIGALVDYLINFASSFNKFELIIFIYVICLLMEIFISSGSAKAFLLIPILMPIANAFGINPQLVILAYAFGDGFSNVVYPTNVGLLISLGMAKVDFKDWFNYSYKFQVLNLLLTSLILIIGVKVM